MPTRWKIGELARRTGISVRALHHYDTLGLLVPSVRTDVGHRLYDASDLAKLQRILSLRQLGFSLEEIALLHRGEVPDFTALIDRHLARVRLRLEATGQLCERLDQTSSRLQRGETLSIHELFDTLEATQRKDRHVTEDTAGEAVTAEQIAALRDRAQQLGQDHAVRAEAEWKATLAQLRLERAQGASPQSARVRALADTWRRLIDEITGKDAALRTALERFYRADPEVASRFFGAPIERELVEFIQQAAQG